tara:strand:+ start:8402 stop:9190 length:789 start_codon:yes stop_codon:yes gene_type:complete
MTKFVICIGALFTAFNSYADGIQKPNDSSWWSFFSSEAEQVLVLRVAEPFVDLRSGPATGYPVFHVSERGETLTIISRKTDWVNVKDSTGRTGWVSVADVQKMQNLAGSPVMLDEPKFEDFNTHPWEAGLLAGDFDKSSVNSAYVGYWMTDNLSLELWASQVLGEASESKLLSLNIVHQVFPTWRFSPFFTLGAGKIFIKPKATLSNESERNEDTLNVGAGVRYYLSNRYFLRFEVKDYKIFTNRETNEEAIEWKLGLSVFF